MLLSCAKPVPVCAAGASDSGPQYGRFLVARVGQPMPRTTDPARARPEQLRLNHKHKHNLDITQSCGKN